MNTDKSDEVLDAIYFDLAERLGKGYEVLNPSQLGEWYRRTGVDVDAIIRNTETNELTVIEVTSSGSSGELPLDTGPGLSRIQEAFRQYDPDILLITDSQVPLMVDRYLRESRFGLLKYSGEEQLLSDLVDTIIQDPPL